MSTNNYKLYQKHKWEIWNMIHDTLIGVGLEDNEDEYLQRRSMEINEFLIQMGFEFKE